MCREQTRKGGRRKTRVFTYMVRFVIMFLTLHVCVSSCRYIGGSSHNLLQGVVVHELLVLKGDEATAADVGALTEYLGKKWDVVLPPRGLR